MNKNKLIIACVATFLIGTGIGYALNSNDDSSMPSSHDHTDTSMTSEHMHETYNVDSQNAPTVTLDVKEDAKSGYNVTLTTTNFEFTPESVNSENIIGQGHAHLYVDGEKVARLYSPYFHYDQNFDGEKVFKVTLNANDHSEYAVDGQVIQDEAQVLHEAHN